MIACVCFGDPGGEAGSWMVLFIQKEQVSRECQRFFIAVSRKCEKQCLNFIVITPTVTVYITRQIYLNKELINASG